MDGQQYTAELRELRAIVDLFSAALHGDDGLTWKMIRLADVMIDGKQLRPDLEPALIEVWADHAAIEDRVNEARKRLDALDLARRQAVRDRWRAIADAAT